MIISPEHQAWITSTRGEDVRLRLFCFPYAGGGVAHYRRWFEQLPTSIDVCPIHLPGREQRIGEAAFTSMGELVTTLVEVLLPYLHEPFAFFGHSMGGLIAYALTRRLEAESLPLPRHLCISALKAPHLLSNREPIHDLPEAEFLRSVYRLGGTPLAVLQNQELLDLILPTLRADFTLYETYTPFNDLPLPCPIAVYGGAQDTLVSLVDLEGWRQHTSAEFLVRHLSGDHFYIHSAQIQLLRFLEHDLRAVLA
ncbi:thioesterase II family protein [Ktedonospora formicarum]|uniref:Thioesterase n=1 Tax=Ktedonospora formicarum TaxID=2778364 RepID=A0A8J3I2U2_9CHLR|nr:thioesterase domain-containing protein [Ktedonospora formicarum]GHO45003.1 thioesterase [Ktedonospora formicarum]